MEGAEDYVDERLNHLGLVAGVCHEIGLATWLDTQEPGNRQQVSVGTAQHFACEADARTAAQRELKGKPA